jgi:hypothetical protein
MGLDTKTYWLTDRQSQCDFDFDFDLTVSVSKWMKRYSDQFSESGLVMRYERSKRTEYKKSACENVKRDWKISWVIIVVIWSDSFCVEIDCQERTSACNSEL